MPEAENTLDALMENEMEQQVIETEKQSIPGESHPVNGFTHCSGQAVVEFTLVFLLFLVIAWIPADFGLAFYSGQLAQNASREAARIAAADPNLGSGTLPGTTWTTSCTVPSCSGNILSETAGRVSSALLSGATVNVTLDADSVPPATPKCDRNVTVTVAGTYNYFFS